MGGEGGKTARRGALARALIAGGSAGGLGVLMWLVVSVFILERSASCQSQGLDCLGALLVGFVAAAVMLVVLAWPLLWLARVRPAWPVALTALPVGFILAHAYAAFTGTPYWLVPGIIVIPACSYAVAALLTTPGARPLRVICLAVVIIALYPAATLWSSRGRNDATAAYLTAPGLPLLAAELPGYRITGAGADRLGSFVYYSLVPDSAPPELTPSMTIDNEKISVLISHTGPLFAPPAHCASNNSYGIPSSQAVADSPPCQPIGNRVWLQRRGNLIVVFTSRDGAVIELDAVAQVTPEATVLHAAENLEIRPPANFPSGL
jgi:hypothetical protein